MVYLLNAIRKNVRAARSGKLMRWMCEVALYREVESAASTDPTIEHRISEKHNLYRFRYHYNLGKRYSMVTGGHGGMPALLPLDSTNTLGITPHKDVQSMRGTTSNGRAGHTRRHRQGRRPPVSLRANAGS